jgi:hypothetical protein
MRHGCISSTRSQFPLVERCLGLVFDCLLKKDGSPFGISLYRMLAQTDIKQTFSEAMTESIAEEHLPVMDLDEAFSTEAAAQPIEVVEEPSAIVSELTPDVFLNGHQELLPVADQPALDIPSLPDAILEPPTMDDVIFETVDGLPPPVTEPLDDLPIPVEEPTTADFDMIMDPVEGKTEVTAPIETLSELKDSPKSPQATGSSEMKTEHTPTSSASEQDHVYVTERAPIAIQIPQDLRLPYSSRQTGIVYDPRMRFHSELDSNDDIHPEDPRRIYEIYRAIVEAGLVEDFTEEISLVKFPPGYQLLTRIEARLALRSEIELAHKPEHHKWVEDLRCKFVILSSASF